MRLLNGNWNALGGKQRGDPNFYRNALIDIVRSDRGIVLGGAGETDEVVTVDTRRVIRWPTSLHGKCGLRVSEFPLDRLDPDGSNPFDPLTEAIALPMSKSITVETTIEQASTRVGEYSIDTNCGDILELPEGVAAFLVLKGWAKLAPSA
jgi:DNA primase small subunit